MATFFDQNGLPDAHYNDAVTDAQKIAVLQTPAQPVISFGSLVGGYLSAFAAAASILIDPFMRIFVGATDEALVTATLAAGTKKTLTIKPVADQTGRSLSWSQTARDVGFPADLGDALKAIVDAPTARPKYRAESLVSALIRAVPEEFQTDEFAPMIEVDQADGSIKIHYWTDAPGEARAMIGDWVAPDSANGVKVNLEEAEPESGPESLVFEGGET